MALVRKDKFLKNTDVLLKANGAPSIAQMVTKAVALAKAKTDEAAEIEKTVAAEEQQANSAFAEAVAQAKKILQMALTATATKRQKAAAIAAEAADLKAAADYFSS